MPTEITLQSEQVSTSPMRLWEKLCKTNPKHAKKFTRAGGFSGTAIKPIWTVMMMTEVFGPCGTGWGMIKPEFVVQPAADEQLVFCTVGVWYVDPASGVRSDAVYGMGGDKFLVSQSKGLKTSDEAYKMAYTDAIGNAIKYLGVAADVHMGLFDDSKYVGRMEAEFAGVSDAPKLTEEKRQELLTSIADCISVKELLKRGEIALNVAKKADDNDSLNFLAVKMSDRMIDIVGESSMLSTLEENFKAAYKVAHDAHDEATKSLLIKAKDKRKEELATETLQSQLKESLAQ